MNTARHMALGAVVAALPDAALAAYGWRREWLPDRHPLVRAHAWLHSPAGAVAVVAAAWASHLVADAVSVHRGPDSTVRYGAWRPHLDVWSYIIRPYDHVRDARRWRWQRRGVCGRQWATTLPESVRAAIVCAALGHSPLYGSAAATPTCRRCLVQYR